MTYADSNGPAPGALAADTDRTPNSAGFSQALQRGLAILSSFSGAGAALGIADLARGTGLSKGTTHRYVATLVALGYLEQDKETRRYRLGHRAVEIGFAALNSIELTRVAAAPLQWLADETGHTVSMAVLDGPEIVYVERRRSARQRQLDLDIHVGTRLPAYCTALGKVLLAGQPDGRLRALLDQIDLARRAPQTITAREHLLSALQRIRRVGLAINDEELAPGLRALAVGVKDRSGRTVAAVAVAVPTTAWDATPEALCRRLEAPLRRVAVDISGRMGHQEP